MKNIERFFDGLKVFVRDLFYVEQDAKYLRTEPEKIMLNLPAEHEPVKYNILTFPKEFINYEED